jgi:hypothetical protein
MRSTEHVARTQQQIDSILRRQLQALPKLQHELVEGKLAVDRWPFREP